MVAEVLQVVLSVVSVVLTARTGHLVAVDPPLVLEARVRVQRPAHSEKKQTLFTLVAAEEEECSREPVEQVEKAAAEPERSTLLMLPGPELPIPAVEEVVLIPPAATRPHTDVERAAQVSSLSVGTTPKGGI